MGEHSMGVQVLSARTAHELAPGRGGVLACSQGSCGATDPGESELCT